MTPTDFLGDYAAYIFPIALVSVILLSFFARYGYTIFKKFLSIAGAVAFGYVGSTVVAPLLMDMLSIQIDFVSIPAIIGIILAIIGAVLIIYVYKLAIFVVGAALGFIVAQLFILPLIPVEGVVAIIIEAVIALIIAILALLLFKPLFIVISSVCGMISAASIAGYVLLPGATPIVLAIFAVIGLVIGIFYARKQFADHKGKA